MGISRTFRNALCDTQLHIISLGFGIILIILWTVRNFASFNIQECS